VAIGIDLLAWTRLLALEGDLAKGRTRHRALPPPTRRRPARTRRAPTAPEDPNHLALGHPARGRVHPGAGHPGTDIERRHRPVPTTPRSTPRQWNGATQDDTRADLSHPSARISTRTRPPRGHHPRRTTRERSRYAGIFDESTRTLDNAPPLSVDWLHRAELHSCDYRALTALGGTECQHMEIPIGRTS